MLLQVVFGEGLADSRVLIPGLFLWFTRIILVADMLFSWVEDDLGPTSQASLREAALTAEGLPGMSADVDS